MPGRSMPISSAAGTAAGDGPVHDVKQGGKQPVVQGEVGAEVRERSRVRLRGAQPHGPQAVRAKHENYLLLVIRSLGRPAQPGPPAAERRVVVEQFAALDVGESPHVHRA